MEPHLQRASESSPLLQPVPRRRSGALALAGGLLLASAVVISLSAFSFNSSPAAESPLQATADNSSTTTAPAPDTPLVQLQVTEGILEGHTLTSRGGRSYLEFRGIPYAKPPLGQLRFRPPQPPEPWRGVRDATRSQPPCIQKRSSNPEPHGSEDCLYLNVFTPRTNQTPSRGRQTLLPTLFYVHGGGGGAEGDGSRYSGAYFMDENVVLVTVDYRLGMLGALNLQIPSASGNQGLKDQVQGLKWVRANIRAFGGDPARITLVGNSAGAHQVSTHLLSPLSRPLIAGVIAQSGSTILPGYLSGDPVRDGVDLGVKMGCPQHGGNMTLLLECFQSKTAQELVLQSIHLRHWFTFTYSVDTASEAGDVFLPEPPLARLQAGAVARVPFMTGVTSAEGLPQALQILLDPERTDAYNQVPWTGNTRVVQDLQLQLSAGEEKGGRIAEEARQFYFGEGNVTKESIETLSGMLSDRLFHHPIYVTAASQWKANNNSTGPAPSVYLYIFSHPIKVSRCQDPRFQVDTVWGIEEFGVCHADELQFFFPGGGTDYPEIGAGHEYEGFSRMVVGLWASFAAQGTPAGTTNNATWDPFSGAPRAFELNESPGMVDFYPRRMAFWDQFQLTDLYR